MWLLASNSIIKSVEFSAEVTAYIQPQFPIALKETPSRWSILGICDYYLAMFAPPQPLATIKIKGSVTVVQGEVNSVEIGMNVENLSSNGIVVNDPIFHGRRPYLDIKPKQDYPAWVVQKNRVIMTERMRSPVCGTYTSLIRNTSLTVRMLKATSRAIRLRDNQRATMANISQDR